MNNLMTYKEYSGSVEYSDDDNILFGRILGIDDLVGYEGASIEELKGAFQDSVDEYLEHCRNIGKTPARPYSGKFTLRLSPELHAKLALKAAGCGKSLNQYAVDILENS